jgi:hypothetical protein
VVVLVDEDVELVVGTGDVVLVDEVLVELVDDEELLVDEDVLVDVLLLVEDVVGAAVVVLVDEDVELDVVDVVEVVVGAWPGVPVQTPSSQWSATVHAFESSQGALLGTHVHWPNAPHTSSVQGLWSSKHGPPADGVPKHTPN